MNREIVAKIDRIKLYTGRICGCFPDRDAVRALAYAAELAEIARRLYNDLADLAKRERKE